MKELIINDGIIIIGDLARSWTGCYEVKICVNFIRLRLGYSYITIQWKLKKLNDEWLGYILWIIEKSLWLPNNVLGLEWSNVVKIRNSWIKWIPILVFIACIWKAILYVTNNKPNEIARLFNLQTKATKTLSLSNMNILGQLQNVPFYNMRHDFIKGSIKLHFESIFFDYLHDNLSTFHYSSCKSP